MDPEAAADRLRGHRVPEQVVLDRLVLPPGPASGQSSPDELLAEARRRAAERGLGAWDTVGWLDRFSPGFLVDDEAFSTARGAAPNVPVAEQVAWLGQWTRPEVWLAALGHERGPEGFPELLEAMQGMPSLSEDALAALLFSALQAADRVAFEEERQQRVEGLPSPEEESWAEREWPALSAQLAEALLQSKPGQSLATEMLILCEPVPNGPRHPAVAWHWHVALAERLPEAAFEQLLARAGNDEDLYALSALQGAAVAAVTHLDEQVEWAARVWARYGAMSPAPWQGWGGSSIGNGQRGGRLPGLLGACLAVQPEPTATWWALWQARSPGAPEGWPADIADWRERAAVTAHVEWVGLCACMDADSVRAGSPMIGNGSLFETIQAALHRRLLEAAGDYQDVDASLLHLLWALGGELARELSWQAVPDHWMAEQQWEFDPRRIHVGPVGE